MQIDLTPDEANLIASLLQTPVQITPAQMPQYVALVQGIVSKLQTKEGAE